MEKNHSGKDTTGIFFAFTYDIIIKVQGRRGLNSELYY